MEGRGSTKEALALPPLPAPVKIYLFGTWY